MDIECEFLDSDDGYSTSPTLPQDGEVSNEEPLNSNEIFLTPEDDSSFSTFQDAMGTQLVNQEPQAFDTGTKQEYGSSINCINSISDDTDLTVELNTLHTPEESSDYSTVPISTQNIRMSTIEDTSSYNADTTGDASSASFELIQEDNPADCVSNSIDDSSLLEYFTNSPLGNGNLPNSTHSTTNPTNDNSIQDNGDIPTVDFSCLSQTLVNEYKQFSPDRSSQSDTHQLNESSPGIIPNTDSFDQTLENQIGYSPKSSNFPNSISQSQTLEISYENIPESPNNPELNSQSQTLDNAIDSNEHSSPPAHSQSNAQTLENSISRYQDDQQLLEECNSNSPHYSQSQTLSNHISYTFHRVDSRQFSDENSNAKFPSFTEDDYLPKGFYKSKFKYLIPKQTNTDIRMGARPPIRMCRKRPQYNTIFPCEDTEVHINENPQSPTRSVDSSAYDDPNYDIDQSILSTLDLTLQSLASAPVEEDPIYISSDESGNEPDLYTQIELMDSKNFELNIAIADLDKPQPYNQDVPVPSLPIFALSDSEPEPKARKPRKVQEKIAKRSKPREDPVFVPYISESTEVSSDELSDFTPKKNTIQKLKDTVSIETEKSDDITKVRKVGRPRKYEKVGKNKDDKVSKKKDEKENEKPYRRYKYRSKKRHAPAHYTMLKERAMRDGRYIPKPHVKKNKKHKKVKYPSESDDWSQPEIRDCRKTKQSGHDWFPKPKMELWATGDTPYETTMQMASNRHKYFSAEEHFNTPYLKKIKLPNLDPQHNIEMKIVNNGKASTSSYSQAKGLRLINPDILAEVFGKLPCPIKNCKGGKLKLYESTFKHGMQNFFVLFCSYCGHIVTKFCSSRQLDQPIDHNIGLSHKMDRSEVNTRAMLGVHTTSLTWKGFRKFANIMDLPTPTTVMRRSEQMKFAEIVLAEVDDSMRKWSKYIADSEGAVKSVRPGCVEVAVSFDGSWKQRGHYSNVGFAAVIERNSKKVVDYELLNRNCEACSKWSTHMMETQQKEYEDWYKAHKPHCKSNFSGTSLAMESEAAVRMWNRSEDRGLVYNVFIGDGDGSGYKSVLRSGVYNGEVEIVKEECIGHLQKRLKNHLMKAAKNTKNTNHVKHALEEHKADRVAHLFAVVVGQHVGKPPEDMSNALWRMLGHISENHDDCPTGPKSYCLYQKHLYRHQNDPSAPAPKIRRCYFTDIDLEKIREEFEIYASVDVCSHLTLGATQNINESLHSCIWSSCLKTKYASPTCVAISVALSVLCFNEGQSALVGVLLALGIQPSINSIKEFVSNDMTRVYMREFGKSDQKKALRRQRKIDSKNRETQRRKYDKAASRILYQSDKYGVEVKGSAKRPKISNKPKAHTADKKEVQTENRVERNEREDVEPDTAGDQLEDGTENDIVDAMEVEIHDTTEFQSIKTAPEATPTHSQEKKTTPLKPKKTTENKPNKTTESKHKKTTIPKQKKITESKQKKITEPKQKKTTENKPKKTTESKTSKSNTKEQNATKTGTKRKKAKVTDKYSGSDTEDEYTSETLKKPKLRKRQKTEDSNSRDSSSPVCSGGEESDGVCEDCDMRVPAGLLKGQWKWIGCEKCERWFHDSCLNVQLDDFGDEDFICKECS